MKYPMKYILDGNPPETDGGMFSIPFECRMLIVVASHGGGWNHVSVSLSSRCPNWREMCFVKDLFFDEEECVIQYHPPKSLYKNINRYCLHLWQPHEIEIPMPPLDFV